MGSPTGIAINVFGVASTVATNEGGTINNINTAAQVGATIVGEIASDAPGNKQAAAAAIVAGGVAFATQEVALANDLAHGATSSTIAADVLSLVGDATLSLGAIAMATGTPLGLAIGEACEKTGEVATVVGSMVADDQALQQYAANSPQLTNVINQVEANLDQVGSYESSLATFFNNTSTSLGAAWNTAQQSFTNELSAASATFDDIGNADFNSDASTFSGYSSGLQTGLNSVVADSGDTLESLTETATDDTEIVDNADGSLPSNTISLNPSTDSSPLTIVAETKNADDPGPTQTTYTNSNGAASLTSIDEENPDGTSALTIYNSDGSSVTTDYSGPDETGSIAETDIENADGTSQITTYTSDGSTTTSYSKPNGTGTPGQSAAHLQYNTIDYNTGAPVTYSAGISFDNTNFVLPSVRAYTSTSTQFGTSAHFITGSLNPYSQNIINISEPDAAGAGNLFVSPTQTSEAITFNTDLVNLGNTPGVYNDVSISEGISEGQSVIYDGSVSAPITLTISGKVYATAVAALSYQGQAGATTYFFRVGSSASINLIVSNTATGALTDSLAVGLAPGAGAGIITSLGSAGYIAAGQSATLTADISTTNSGFYSIAPSNFTFISHDSDLADVAASSSGYTSSVEVFAPAVAGVSFASSTYYFHVGDNASLNVTVGNTATGTQADSIHVGVAQGASAGIVSGLPVMPFIGAGNSDTLTVNLNTSTSGSYTVGSPNFAFTSHDSDLQDVVAASGGSSATVNINKYAAPILADASTGSNPGILTQSGNNWTLNFGTLTQSTSASTAQALIRIEDGTSAGAMDSLEGSLSVSGSGFLDSSSFDISGDVAAAGGFFTLGQFTPDVTTLGVHTETIVFHPTGFNASGYSGSLANQTLTITDDVIAAPSPTLTVSNDGSATRGQSIALSTLVTIADPGNVGYQMLQLWDSDGTVAGGEFLINGAPQTAGHAINVPAGANVVFETGTLGGTDTLWAQLVQDNGSSPGWEKFTVTAPAPAPPTLTVTSDGAATRGQSISLSTLLTVSDPSNVGYQMLQLWDSDGTVIGGEFKINGMAQTAGHAINVPAGANVVFDAGSLGGTDTLWAQLGQDDGSATGWEKFTVTAPKASLPTLTVSSDGSASRGQSIALSTLLTVSDPSNVGYQMLQLWDSDGTATGGEFLINGAPQTAGHAINVPAGANVWFETGSLGGTDTLWAQLVQDDGSLTGWEKLTVTAPAARTPTLNATSKPTAVSGQTIALSSLVSISDPDSVGYQMLQLWDSDGTAAGGEFLINRTPQSAGHAINVPAGANVVFDAGTSIGTDTLWAQLIRGGTAGGWDKFTITVPNPTVAVQNFAHATPGQTIALSNLVTISDPGNVGYQKLELWDSDGTTSTGQFMVGGVGQTGGHEIDVNPANVAGVVFDEGSTGNTDTLWARLQLDNGSVTAWQQFTVVDPLDVAAGTTLELPSAYAGTVIFEGSTGTLQLDDSASFSGTVAGMSGSDTIDLRNVGFNANPTLSDVLGYTTNAANNGGSLNVSDGTHSAQIALLGQYSASSFAVANDGHGGISIEVQATPLPVLAQSPHA